MTKIILHVDLNAFFVRCEEIRNPSLEGKPVIIGHSGRRGIVSTCSYKAREFGVRSGMPTFMAMEKCPNAIIIHPDYYYYEEMSHRFFKYLENYSKIIEPASIDECYMDLTSYLNKKDAIKELSNLQQGLYKQTGLMCSIGVAPTKFLAKMASDMKKPMGITILRRKDLKEKLYPLKIEDCYGIGKKTYPELKKMGINTIGDLADRLNNDPNMERFFGKFFYVIKDWINGRGSDEVSVEPWDPKSIGNSRTLMKDTNDLEELKSVLSNLCHEVSDRAKEADKVGTTVQITLKDSELINGSFKTITRSVSYDKPINDYETIFYYASSLLEKNLSDRLVRLVGVTLQNLIDKGEENVQLSIFDNYDELKEEYATKLLIAELNRKMNKDVFKTAREELVEKKYGLK